MTDTVKKTVSLYDGAITVHFDNRARNRYMIEETQSSPVGVTTILQSLSKEGLMLWPMYEAIDWLKKNCLTPLSKTTLQVTPEDLLAAEKAYTIKSDKGKNVGTQVHALIERFLTDQEFDSLLPVDLDKPFRSFVRWFEKAKPRVLATEQIIYSKQLDYAGTYDALLEIDGKVILCDVKTTNASRSAPLGIYPEYFLQLGAYSLAHHEENPLELIDDVMIIRVGKDGVLNTLRASELGFNLAYLEDTFRQLLLVYRFMQPLVKTLAERKK